MADYLPPVVTKLTGDIDDFLAKLAAAEAAMNEFADHVANIPIAFDIDEASIAKVEAIANALGDSLRPEINVQYNVGSIEVAKLIAADTAAEAASASLSDAINRVADSENLTAKDTYLLAMAQTLQAKASRAQADAASQAAKDTYLLAMANRMNAATADDATAATTRSGIAIGRWGLSWNALHWIVAGTMEFLAVAIPAIVAGAAAVDVGLQGFTEGAARMQALYAATESLGGAFGMTAGQALGLKDNLQSAQNAADPEVWELLGGAINAVRASSGGFIQMGEQVLLVLDRFVAEIDVDLQGAMGTTLTGLVSKGSQDLTEFGQVLGNLGHFIMNVASEMPGLAEILLSLLSGVTRFLAVVSNVGPLLTFAMALEETWRWGGLVASIFAWVLRGAEALVIGLGNVIAELAVEGSAMAAFGVEVAGVGFELGTVAAFMSGPWGWVIIGAAVGLGVLIDKLVTAQTAAQKFTTNMEAALGKLNVTQGLFTLTQDLNTLSQGLNTANSSMATLTATGHQYTTANYDVRFGLQSVSTAYSSAAETSTAYSAAQQKLIGQFIDAQNAAESVSRVYGVSLTSAYSMLDNAGLNLNTMFTTQGGLTKVAQQQIANLALGYQDMTGPAGALGNSINAVDVQLGLQGSQLSKVNGAWDAFLANATGGTSAFASLQDDMQTLGNVTTSLNEKVSAFSLQKGGITLATAEVAKALTSFSGQSAQVWQNYDAALTQAGTVTDWWRTAAASGTITGKQLNQAIAATAGQLVPYAANSKAAASELGVLVQEAGGPAITSYSQLKSWVDQNSISQGQYTSLLNSTTSAMSNVTAAAQQFSQTLQGDVVQAVANGALNLVTVTQNTQKFTSALNSNGPASTQVHSAMMSLAGEFHTAGFNAQTAGSLIYQLGIQQGDTKTQAHNLMMQMEGLINTLNSIPKNVTSNVSVNETIYPTVSGKSPTASTPNFTGQLPMAAKGARVPGYGGGDIFGPIMVEPGEAIVPKHLVSGVAPYLGAHNVPGFAEGGYMGGDYTPGAGSGEGTIQVNVYLDGKQIQKTVQKQTYKTNRRNGPVTGKLTPH